MEIKPKFGIDQLLFGMQPKEVEKLWGKPNLQLIDDDENTIYIYHEKYCRLSFYKEEGKKLSLILSSNPLLTYKSKQIIHQSEAMALEIFKDIKNWTKEDEDITTIYFDEENWIYLQMEFKKLSKVELGVIAKNIDEFDWKF